MVLVSSFHLVSWVGGQEGAHCNRKCSFKKPQQSICMNSQSQSCCLVGFLSYLSLKVNVKSTKRNCKHIVCVTLQEPNEYIGHWLNMLNMCPLLGRQWVYQTCTEFGFYQSTDSPNQPFTGFPLPWVQLLLILVVLLLLLFSFLASCFIRHYIDKLCFLL